MLSKMLMEIVLGVHLDALIVVIPVHARFVRKGIILLVLDAGLALKVVKLAHSLRVLGIHAPRVWINII